MTKNLNLIDNPSIQDRNHKFTVMTVDLNKIVKDWKKSLYSFEWLLPDGSIRPPEKLTTDYRHQTQNIEQIYQLGGTLERPVLGFGMMDNVEIGSRKEVLLTLARIGVENLEVHVPTSCSDDFKKFRG
jgi:hypothetical protein